MKKNNDNNSNYFENHYYSENLYHIDLNYEKFDDFENTVLINNTISIEIFCRFCFEIFSFNNRFHKHLRKNSCRKHALNNANVFINNRIILNVIISRICFKINSNQNIKIDYDFRD